MQKPLTSNEKFLAETDSYEFAMDIYQKLMFSKVNMGNENLDLAEVIVHLNFIAATDQHPIAKKMYANLEV